MIQRNKGRKLYFHAEFVIEGEKGKGFKQSQVVALEEKVEEIRDPIKRADAEIFLVVAQVARKIILEKGEIKYYFNTNEYGRISENGKITNNLELYNLIKKCYFEAKKKVLP